MRNNFDWFDTPNPTERGFVVTAKEDELDDTIPDFRTTPTTWSDCPAWIKRACEIRGDLQDYVLSHTAKGGPQLRNFYFTKAKTAEQAATAISSNYDVDPSSYWPPVLLRIEQYARPDGTWTLKPIYKEAYSGPMHVLIEEFFSPTPHAISLPTSMRPQGVDDVVRPNAPFDFSIGRLVLKECLHGPINLALPLDPPIVDGAVTYLNGVLYVPATNLTDWPATIVLDDRQRQVLGGWLRRRVTGIKPA